MSITVLWAPRLPGSRPPELGTSRPEQVHPHIQNWFTRVHLLLDKVSPVLEASPCLGSWALGIQDAGGTLVLTGAQVLSLMEWVQRLTASYS